MQAIFRPISLLACCLLLAACERNDPRYPVYYSYRVDVKVDGVPVTIERVIKCTGTLVTDWMVSPGTTTGGDYANPPVIGAKVPGAKSAVYTPRPISSFRTGPFCPTSSNRQWARSPMR